MRVKKRISRIAYHTVVLAVGFVMIYPLLWMEMCIRDRPRPTRLPITTLLRLPLRI